MTARPAPRGSRPVAAAGRVLLRVAVALGPVALALVASMVVIEVAGGPAIQAMAALWSGAFGGVSQIARTLSLVVPMSLIALGWIIAFTARRMNIGFEGQVVVGGITAAVVGLYVPVPSRALHLALVTVAAVLAGAAYAGVAAQLWARFGVNEIISTLMLNFVALETLAWLVRGPLQEPDVIFPRSPLLPDTARWPTIVPHSALTWSIAFVPVAVVAVQVLRNRTTFGMALRLTGVNPVAARHAGVPTRRVSLLALVISGALAGMAGSFMVNGSEAGRLADGFSSDVGFDGIVVALVARNQPLAVVPAALLFAALKSGGSLMESRVDVSSELVMITQGLVILMVAGAAFLLRGGSRGRGDAVEPDPDGGSGQPSVTETVAS